MNSPPARPTLPDVRAPDWKPRQGQVLGTISKDDAVVRSAPIMGAPAYVRRAKEGEATDGTMTETVMHGWAVAETEPGRWAEEISP